MADLENSDLVRALTDPHVALSPHEYLVPIVAAVVAVRQSVSGFGGHQDVSALQQFLSVAREMLRDLLPIEGVPLRQVHELRIHRWRPLLEVCGGERIHGRVEVR